MGSRSVHAETFELLKRFYNSCKDQLDLQGKLKMDSVLLSCLEVKNNVRYRVLNESAIPAFKLEHAALDELIQRELVREVDEVSRYAITARGIWQVERTLEILDEVHLLKFLDSKNFDLFGGEPKLTDREKVILLALVAARAFSEKSCVDLRRDTHTMDGWRAILEKSHNFLHHLNVAEKLKADELFRPKGNEHPVSHLIRHTDALPRKTKGLYKAPGKQKYYLGLYEGTGSPADNLAYLFRMILEGNLSVDGIDSVLAFCSEVAYGDSIQVFDFDHHDFSKTSYDDVLREGLRKSIVWRK